MYACPLSAVPPPLALTATLNKYAAPNFGSKSCSMAVQLDIHGFLATSPLGTAYSRVRLACFHTCFFFILCCSFFALIFFSSTIHDECLREKIFSFLMSLLHLVMTWGRAFLCASVQSAAYTECLEGAFDGGPLKVARAQWKKPT